MLDTLANTKDPLPAAADDWITGAVRNVMTDPWTRTWLMSHPAIQVLARLPRKTASTFLWSLYDKNMPEDKEAYEAGFLAWSKAHNLKQAASGEKEAPNYSSLGHAVRNFQDAYSEHGLSPSLLALHGLDHPTLLQQMVVPDAIRKDVDALRNVDTVGDNQKYRNLAQAAELGMAAAAIAISNGGDENNYEGEPPSDGGTAEDEAQNGANDGVSDTDEANDPSSTQGEGSSDGEQLEETPQGEDDEGRYVRVKDELHGHHPCPKYMGGPEEQELYYLPKILHDDYHYELYQVAERDLDYAHMDEEQKLEIFRDVVKMTKKFDAKYRTEIFEYMIRNGFPAK